MRHWSQFIPFHRGQTRILFGCSRVLNANLINHEGRSEHTLAFSGGLFALYETERDRMRLPNLPFPETKCASFDIHKIIPCYKGFFPKTPSLRLLTVRHPCAPAIPSTSPKYHNHMPSIGETKPQGCVERAQRRSRRKRKSRNHSSRPSNNSCVYLQHFSFHFYHFIFLAWPIWVLQGYRIIPPPYYQVL